MLRSDEQIENGCLDGIPGQGTAWAKARRPLTENSGAFPGGYTGGLSNGRKAAKQ